MCILLNVVLPPIFTWLTGKQQVSVDLYYMYAIFCY